MKALAGAASGAYATVSFRLSLAPVGVAMAIVLVPPLAGVGIWLSINSRHVVAKQLCETTTRFTLQQYINSSFGSHLTGDRFEMRAGRTMAMALVYGPNPPSATQVAAMEHLLPPSPDGTCFGLLIHLVPLLVIGSTVPRWRSAMLRIGAHDP